MITVPLTKGHSATIDDADADLAQHAYWASVNGQKHAYAKRYIRGSRPYRSIYLHREIAERLYGPIPANRVVDHIDGDTLNCRRSNIRVVSHRANSCNLHGAGRDSGSGIRGVRLHRHRWQAYICVGRKMYNLGSFDTAEEARAARLAAERERELSIAA